MKKVYVFLVTISLLGFSCNQTKVDENDEAQLLRQTTDSLLAALKAKDVETFAKFYEQNAFSMYAGSGQHHGKDEIRKSYATGFALPGFYISGSIQEVQVAKSGDIGYTLVPWDSYYISESGEKIVEQGINLLVWKKQDNGTWRVIIEKP